ncbi:MAG: preprotein translocase subunit SecG [Planctomycetes bacterium]|nr:preprotein translocase subunit SecG [Planctomycetota bacterium]MCB9903099.1 preprotein translocase subunit SecG [Planctomycetota bacterium]
MTLAITLLYIVFVLSAIVLVTIILLQEGQGGGFTDALGTAGKQAFGVKARGIQSFTGIVALIWIASGVGIHIMNRQHSGSSLVGDGATIENTAPADSGTGTGN